MTATEAAAADSLGELTPTLEVEHLEVTHRVPRARPPRAA